jgi:membrane-associated phospholipid phosphatase
MPVVHQQNSTGAHVPPLPALWHEPAPHHFDLAFPWWLKTLLVAAAAIAAIYFLDSTIARWALTAQPINPGGAWHLRSDITRELAMLEQWGQWTCSILVILAVALIDKAGRRRALAIAIACLLTVLLTYLLKDLFGRSRPGTWHDAGVPLGQWLWGGPARGFTGGSKWGSFPSAHTTGAFALAAALSWFYPKARALFMTLATITAAQRVLHAAHFLSDVIAAMGLAVLVTRSALQARLPGRYIAALPPAWRDWFLHDA